MLNHHPNSRLSLAYKVIITILYETRDGRCILLICSSFLRIEAQQPGPKLHLTCSLIFFETIDESSKTHSRNDTRI